MPKKLKRVIWSPKAKRDLGDVWHYYARVASEEIADKLLREIDQAAKALSDRAFMSRARDEIMSGLRSVLVHPYSIFYRVNDDTVEVVRVLHERRDFASLLSKKEL